MEPETTTADVATDSADVTVEASKSVTAAGSPIFTAPRSPITTGVSYLEHSIKASLGDSQSREWVQAADDTTSLNPGVVLPQHMTSFVSNTFAGGRPAIDAISREALIDNGMSFTIPRVTAVPTVATVAESGSTSETGMTSDYLTVDVKKASGRNIVTWELLDRSSPAFYTELLKQLQLAYASTTDKAVLTALGTSGTAATIVTADAAGLQSFVSVEQAAALKGSGLFARNLLASVDHWSAIAGYADTTGRPMYTAGAPSNSAGTVSGQSLTGTILGQNLYVDPNFTTSGLVDNSAFLIVPEAAMYYESPTTQLQVINTGSGKVEIALYGYYAIAVKQPLGIRKFNVA
jgi:HK97 family phage major capsid protein